MNRREFSKMASVFLLLKPFKDRYPYFSEIQPEGLLKNCLLTFSRYREVWEFNDFWKRGNTFDACLNFSDALFQKWPNEPEVRSISAHVDSMLEKNYTFFFQFDPNGLWADDFGWWGLMGLNARKHLMRTGNVVLAKKYFELATNLCWEFKKKSAYDFSDQGKPVPHGCRNGDAAGQSKGVKNTVTNVLLFLLSTRIYRTIKEDNLNIPDSDKYLEMAYKQWLWFESWFKMGQYKYLKTVKKDSALVQERPTAFFDGSDYGDKNHPTWQPDWVWSGDQGMILAALTDMLKIKDDLTAWSNRNNSSLKPETKKIEDHIKTYVNLISNGIKSILIGSSDNIIREAPLTANFGPEFGNDYLAGRGILMRYLGQLSKELDYDFSKAIGATVHAIWTTRSKDTNQFKPRFTAEKDDQIFIADFRKLWGTADDTTNWQIQKMEEKQRDGVCQSIGLDAYGAILRLSK